MSHFYIFLEIPSHLRDLSICMKAMWQSIFTVKPENLHIFKRVLKFKYFVNIVSSYPQPPCKLFSPQAGRTTSKRSISRCNNKNLHVLFLFFNSEPCRDEVSVNRAFKAIFVTKKRSRQVLDKIFFNHLYKSAEVPQSPVFFFHNEAHFSK